MTTKNLSRTVIEGGRASSNKRDRRRSNRQQRIRNRRFSKSIVSLVDPDDAGLTPERDKVGKDFTDKLSPMYRWLGKQVGKRWDNVFSELVHRFDTRTVAGNHVIRDHLLRSITIQPTDAYRNDRNDYYVDECSILRLQPPKINKKDRLFYPNRYKSIQKWINNRRVMDYGVSLFWMVPEKIEWTKCGLKSGYYRSTGQVYWSTGSGPCSRNHRYVPSLERVYVGASTISLEKLVKKIEPSRYVNGKLFYREVLYRETERRECQQASGKWRQGPRLSTEDMEKWSVLTAYEKNAFLHAGSVQRKTK